MTALFAALTIEPVRAQPITKLGAFSGVTSKDDGEHCSGYSMALWSLNGRAFGLIDFHAGLCGDPPCSAIDEVEYDPDAGTLHLRAAIPDTASFEGVADATGLRGRLGQEYVELARLEELRQGSFPPDTSLTAWCAFWKAVPRCTGVADLCKSLGVDG
ncbi:MAG: hypothetical protein R3282_07765 [Rhodothermales bacterium]|nr:hypothetical protein [Rhodothermales bacterium]